MTRAPHQAGSRKQSAAAQPQSRAAGIKTIAAVVAVAVALIVGVRHTATRKLIDWNPQLVLEDWITRARIEAIGDVALQSAASGKFVLRTLKHIGANETLLVVPLDSCMTSRSIDKSPLGPELRAHRPSIEKILGPAKSRSVLDPFEHFSMALFLIWHRRRSTDSFFHDWMKIMIPAEFVTETSWAPEVVRRCFPHDHPASRSWHRSVESLSQNLKAAQTLIQSSKSVRQLLGDVSIDDLRWALPVISSRGYVRPPPLGVTIVPLLDVVDKRAAAHCGSKNVDPNALVHFNETLGAAYLVASRDLARGDVVYLNAVSPMDALRSFGFVDAHAEMFPSELVFDPQEFPNLPGECRSAPALFLFRNGTMSPVLQRCATAAAGGEQQGRELVRQHAVLVLRQWFSEQIWERCSALAQEKPATRNRGAREVFQVLTMTREVFSAVARGE